MNQINKIKPNRRPRVLAIDPGTRQMGIAVLDGRELVYHGVKSLRAVGSPHDRLEEGRRVVLQLLRDFRPDVLAVEHAFFAKSRNTALLNVFVDEIRALARQNRIAVRSLAPSTVKKGICGDGAATKRQVAEAVVARYPELKVYLGQDRKWKERFHGNMFDAVAIAVTASRKDSCLQFKPSSTRCRAHRVINCTTSNSAGR